MSAAKDIFLYWGSGSAPCWSPMIVLEEKGLSGYGNKLVSFAAKEHKSEEIMKLNPRGQVPTFKHGDVVLNESKGICHYLENQFKGQGTQLISDEPMQQARILQRMYEADNLLQKGPKNIMYYLYLTPKEKIDEDHLVAKRKELADELKIWEAYLTTSYFVGEEFTMADVFTFPVLAFLVRGGLSLEGRPNLKKYLDKLAQRPSIQASWPPHWKDSPAQKTFEGV